MIIRRLHPGFLEEQPQMLHLLDEASGQFTGVILPVGILAHQANETGIEHVPFADRGWGFGHMAQPLQLLVRPGATLGYFSVFPFRQRLGLPNQVRQAGLPQPHPLHVDTIPVTDQDAAPVLDQSRESLFRPIAMDHEEGNHCVAHDPQPLEQSLAPPGCFIHMVDGGISRDLGDGFVVWQYGGGHSVDDVLNATLADPQTQDREKEILDDAPAVSLGSCHHGNHRRQSRAKARSLFRRNERLYYFLTILAAPSIEDDVCHIQFNFREFDNLVDVVWLNVREVATSAGAFSGKYFRELGRPEALLPRPFTRFLGFGALGGRSFALGEGIVTGRRLVRIRGILLELGFELLDALPERLNFIVQGMHISQHQPRSVQDDFVRQGRACRNWSTHVSTMRIN